MIQGMINVWALSLTAGLSAEDQSRILDGLNGSGSAVQAAAQTAGAGGDDLWSMTLRMSAALAIVLAVVIAAAWAAKRYAPGAFGRVGSGERIDILANRTLGMRRSLVVARVRNRIVLLGVTPREISALSEWLDEESWSSAAEEARSSQAALPAPGNGAKSSALQTFENLLALRGARTNGKAVK